MNSSFLLHMFSACWEDQTKIANFLGVHECLIALLFVGVYPKKKSVIIIKI